METQFRNLDVAIQSQPMPPEFRDTKAAILCNDCSGRSTAAYHWLGLKCSICRSYNTVELQIFGSDELQRQIAVADIAAAPGPNPLLSEQSREGQLLAQPNRRRHSSHAPESQFAAPDRVARSLSPIGIDLAAAQLTQDAETDSEDENFGFWGGTNHHYGDAEDDDSYEETDSEDGSGGEDDVDDDDDDEDEIILIGHR